MLKKTLIDLIYQLAKQHDLRRVILATHKDGYTVLRGQPFLLHCFAAVQSSAMDLPLDR